MIIMDFDPKREVDDLMLMVSVNSLHNDLFPIAFLSGEERVKIQIAPALYQSIYNKDPAPGMTFEDCYNDPGVKIALTKLYDRLMERARGIQSNEDMRKVVSSIKDSHKPAPEGTVAELSEKYGVSKSEVRRLKREGRLQDLLETRTNG